LPHGAPCAADPGSDERRVGGRGERPGVVVTQLLEHCEPGDRFWDPLVFTDMLTDFDVPPCLIDNWYDYQLPRTIAD